MAELSTTHTGGTPSISGNFRAFAGVDTASEEDARGLAAFLDRFAETVKRNSPQEYSSRMLGLLDLKPGHSCADVGCGVGRDLLDFARLIGPTGQLYGIDFSERMIGLCEERLKAHGVKASLQAGDARRLHFQNASLDRLYCERVLQYIPDPETAIQEFRRVLKSGGKLAIFDSDWDTAIINHPNKEATRKILQALSDSFPSGTIGRSLKGLATHIGFVNVQAQTVMLTHARENAEYILLRPIRSLVTTGKLDSGSVSEWFAELDEVAKRGEFFAALAGVAMGAEAA